MSTLTQTSRRLPPLRTVREAQGLTLRQVARQACIDPAHLSRVERGESGLSVDALCRLAKVLGIRQLADLLEQYRLELSPETRVPALAGNEGTRGNDRGPG
jgi:transcriptional regulator with XRE-family HTH domain